ncbi:DUF4178 domain-containing protein [Aquincola sp. S2]|uniref:DUF4178 domain-containing protein n=1 Tax=Pseudaquabacterium terrae TaxID=2732868 RepID=A0ABX2EC88_9BURK|nr:DUF4178 domain-containing protein [Aquabacterium terrae]NRF66226.1 DUF4178 domain-containing protein [Aquabacterium terrae]
MATGSQRVWRAACPNCGAPVEFASAASASAVCSFCRSTLLRDGEALKRIGQSAELFDDHSPLQLGASGKHEGAAFTIVGRQQIGYEGGSWNEWHILFNDRSAWLSEDNGAYVIAVDAPLTGPVPEPGELFPGQRRVVSGAIWDVASVQQAKVLAAEGELPLPPRLDGGEFAVADLRNQQDEVGTLDWRDAQRPSWSVGRSVRLVDLALTGLRGESEKTLRSQAMNCPNCGASLEPKLDSTKSIVCGQCDAVVDISKGPGADLTHYQQQAAGTPPLIPLGRSGKLALGAKGTPAIDWQVVGYVERIEVDVEAGEDQPTWREYLLYNRSEGFAFLVDAEDGWSYARPITGVPKIKDQRVDYQGKTYQQLYSYSGAVTHVLGEFYWRLARGEKTRNTDFAAGELRLNREQTGKEVTWSAGAALDSDAVATAFGLGTSEALAMRRDAKAFGGGTGRGGVKTWLIVLVVAVVLISIVSSCGDSDDCQPLRQSFGEASAEYQQCLRSQRSGSAFRTGGGAFGGFSSGGGHK